MDALKDRFTEVVGEREFGGCDSKAQAPYYLKRLEDNLYEPMDAHHAAAYGRGSGKEGESHPDQYIRRFCNGQFYGS